MAPSHRPYRRSETVHGLFRWCAERWPGAVALVHGDRRMTYRELDALSDDYAAELAARGVQPRSFVPVLLPRDPEMVAVLLAVLKCGAAYAALDPAWPRERRLALIGQLDARLVVAREGGWPVPSWAPVAGATGRGRPAPAVEADGEDPCQVFFTSGSTGRPKGVVVPHSGTARLYDACVWGDFGPGTVQVQTLPAHWDGSIVDLWSVLLCGGTSVFVDEVLRPELLRRLRGEQGVNTAWLPTAVFNMIVDESPDAFEGLRQVFIGGEQVSPAHCRRFLEHHPGIPLSNTYGPVESAGIVTHHRITPADTTDPLGVPIGVPVSHSEVYVLDGDRSCGPGESGELCLAGDGLAIGYLREPTLTERQFTDVDTPEGPRRIYRTGDCGLRTERGVLHIQGRTDLQVKIRGHRVEPSEVECAAEELRGVRQAVAVPLRDAEGACTDLRLCYVAEPGDPLDEETLWGALVRRLPQYLVPREIIRVGAIPLTRNGKTDRARLAAPRAVARPHEDPLTGTVATTVEIFRQVLARPGVSPSASLLSLGANSLELARICTRVATETDRPVPLSQLYRTPSAASLAGWLERAPAAADPAPGAEDDLGGAVPLTVGQLNYLHSSDSTSSLLAWRVEGALDLDAMEAALNDLHRRHPALRAHYRRTDPPTLQVPSAPGEVEFVRLPRDAADGTRRERFFAALQQPLAPTQGKIWRAVTVPEDDAGAWLFGLALHHIAFDASSSGLITDDLTLAYAARLGGREPVWPRPVPHLAQVAAEHLKRLEASDLPAQRDYWRRTLRGLPPIRLPGAAAASAVAGPALGRVRRLPAEVLVPWEEEVKSGRTTRFGYLAAVFGEALRSLTGQWDIGFLAPVAARGNPLQDATVTCRVNPVCLRLRRPRGSRADVLTQTQQVINEAFAGQDLSLGEVVAALSAFGPFGSVLRTLPVLLVQDDNRRQLSLPGCTAEFIDDRPGKDMPSPLAVEVLLDQEGATLRVGVRTDLLRVGFADTVAEEFLRVLRAGPGNSRPAEVG
ncbi:amino acid adenylation domain-containing protein [Streptomyces sp. NPDC048483]|uniref:amino acid adenylation domain-containing protein n=1 Tax=Streptomyces sp. NPDC048483 TaxID=3154927 RepID=UPI003441ECF2